MYSLQYSQGHPLFKNWSTVSLPNRCLHKNNSQENNFYYQIADVLLLDGKKFMSVMSVSITATHFYAAIATFSKVHRLVTT